MFEDNGVCIKVEKLSLLGLQNAATDIYRILVMVQVTYRTMILKLFDNFIKWG